MTERESTESAERRVQGFIDKFAPEHQRVLREARGLLRARFPTAYELVYDNYNFFVLGYSPTERPSDSIISITGGASGIGLCFIRGVGLPDPHEILLGGGKQTRFIRLPSADVLSRPEVRHLIDAAEARSGVAMRQDGEVELIIRSVSANQRPRQKPG